MLFAFQIWKCINLDFTQKTSELRRFLLVSTSAPMVISYFNTLLKFENSTCFVYNI